jgi:hypothetical protein
MRAVEYAVGRKIGLERVKRRDCTVDRVEAERQGKSGSIPGKSKSFFSFPKWL